LNLDWLAVRADPGGVAFWLANLPGRTRLHVLTRENRDFGWLSGIDRLAGLTLAACPTDLEWLSGFAGLEEFGFDSAVTCSDNYELSPLTGLKNLSQLKLRAIGVSDISALAAMTQLRKLFLWANVDNMDALAGLENLSWLNFRGNDNPDISALSGLLALEQLRLMNNGVSDISALANLGKLQLFYGMDNGIADISPLSALTKMKDLRIASNNIEDISFLEGMTELKMLELHSNQIVDVSPLAALTALERLNLSFNAIGGHDVGNIDQLTTLTKNTGLSIEGNPGISCAELDTLVAAFGDAVNASPGACTLP
jgi:internalin A